MAQRSGVESPGLCYFIIFATWKSVNYFAYIYLLYV